MPMYGEPPEKYKDYRNRTMNKTIEKIIHIMWGIRSNSLKKEDKIKLMNEIIETVESFNVSN